MSFRVISIISILLLFSGCIKHSNKENELQSAIESAFQKNPDAIGIMVHVEAPEQSISWSQAIGYSNLKKTDTIEADQPALIASITKNYVAVSILRLVEQGRLELFQSLDNLLSEKTSTLMKQNGFDLESIKVAHLLAHKSGIPDYNGSHEFQNKIKTDPMYRWTRDEQINLALIQGPINPPATQFYYTDTNYLLLCEILEQITGLEYYDAIRELVDYEKFALNKTWFYSLEPIPVNTKALIHQYVPENNEDSYAIDNSVDLYGGGGLAATTKDLAKYAYNVFQGNVFGHMETLELMFTDVKVSEGDTIEDDSENIPCRYFFGIEKCEFNGLTSYLHGGYWGTIFRYFPELNASVVIYVVNESAFANIEDDLMKQITEILKYRIKLNKNKKL